MPFLLYTRLLVTSTTLSFSLSIHFDWLFTLSWDFMGLAGYDVAPLVSFVRFSPLSISISSYLVWFSISFIALSVRLFLVLRKTAEVYLFTAYGVLLCRLWWCLLILIVEYASLYAFACCWRAPFYYFLLVKCLLPQLDLKCEIQQRTRESVYQKFR